MAAAAARPDPSGAEQAAIREAKPTFTPTPSQLVASQADQQSSAADAVPTIPAVPAPTGAKVVINTPLVNVRSGPGLDFEVVTIVERGQEFDILTKDSLGEWWEICCVEDESVWVIDQLVDTDGPVDRVPVRGQRSGSVSAPAAAPLRATGGEDIQFELSDQEQFSESELVRIFMYVHDDNEGLADYSLRVLYNGTELPVNAVSFGGQPGFTWPFQDARQRSQNWKAEFRDIGPAGTWEVQLLDGSGQLVGPPTTFTLESADLKQELYVQYERP